MKNSVLVRTRLRSLGLALRRKLLPWLWKQRSTMAHQRFAIIPGDAISDEVAIAGLYEEAILVPLFEKFLASRAREFANGVAVDVGANIGNHTLFFARYFRRVLAFEPNPTALAVLQCNVSLARLNGKVRVLPYGLGESTGRLQFFENVRGNLGHSGFGFAGVSTGESVSCEIRRGDDELPGELCDLPVILIKVDVEGAELAALRGLVATIQQYKPIVLFESLGANGESGGRKVAQFLKDLGYSLFSVEDVTAHYPALLKFVARLLNGERASWKPLYELEDRKYQMIVGLSSQQ